MNSFVVKLMAFLVLATQMDPNFAQMQRQNAEALRQYTWKSRTEVRRGSETKSIQLNLMRYDLNGMLQKTPLSSTPQPQLPQRGLRGHVAQKKKENFLEMLDDLAKLAKSYSELPADKMQRFMATALVTPETGLQQKWLRIKGNDVLQPGDSMTLWVDAATRKMRKTEIQTTLEMKPVKVVSEFQDLASGLSYMARSVVTYPREELTVITENFDYEK